MIKTKLKTSKMIEQDSKNSPSFFSLSSGPHIDLGDPTQKQQICESEALAISGFVLDIWTHLTVTMRNKVNLQSILQIISMKVMILRQPNFKAKQVLTTRNVGDHLFLIPRHAISQICMTFPVVANVFYLSVINVLYPL
jgi:hypothetical protein